MVLLTLTVPDTYQVPEWFTTASPEDISLCLDMAVSLEDATKSNSSTNTMVEKALEDAKTLEAKKMLDMAIEKRTV